jgi:hypothetical protein
VALLVVISQNPTVIINNEVAVRTPLNITTLDCTQLEPLWLLAQSVPSATLLPCVASRLPGWEVADVAANNGRSVITLDHDRAGAKAVVVRLTAVCAPAGAVEVPPPAAGVRRYQRVERLGGGEFQATWWDRFPGGCVTYRLRSTNDPGGGFASEAPLLLGLVAREGLRQALDQRSDGRLGLDPGPAR